MAVGLTVREIISTADAYVKNSISMPIKVMWINSIMNAAYRDYPTVEAIAIFSVAPGQEFFNLPEDCPIDRISALTMDEKSYEYIPDVLNTEVDYARFCTTYAESLMIYPPAKEATKAYLHYKPRPVQMTLADLGKIPNFPPDYHEMLIFGLAARLAKTSPETAGMAPIFESDFRELANKADKMLIKPRQKKVIVNRVWR